MRIGQGYDSHRFEAGRHLVLGGVEFSDECGLKGHSDADVLIHAIIDALFGAAALGDIGSHFPDNDEKWRGADSAELLRKAVAEVRAAGYEIVNIDTTVICEQPRISPRIAEIRERLSQIMAIPVGNVSVKAKTNEKMDDVGAGVGIVVHSIALLA